MAGRSYKHPENEAFAGLEDTHNGLMVFGHAMDLHVWPSSGRHRPDVGGVIPWQVIRYFEGSALTSTHALRCNSSLSLHPIRVG